MKIYFFVCEPRLFLLLLICCVGFIVACSTSNNVTPTVEDNRALTPDLASETVVSPTTVPEPTSSTPPSPTPAPIGVVLDSLYFPKAFFLPGEAASWQVNLTTDIPADIMLTSKVTFLDQILVEEQQEVSLEAAEYAATFTWQPPAAAPRGYGLDITVTSTEGELLDSQSAAFDVLAAWTQHPRYGFMTNFPPDRDNGAQALDILLRYHINGLQFYDWMYRHEQYLPPDSIYKDRFGRELSLETVRALIEAAHERNMAAMAYATVYAASADFYRDHESWGLYQADGEPADFENGFLMIMNPRPDTPWTNYLLDQFSQILAKVPFDGIHLDQFGWPKEAYDAEGNFFSLDEALADLINSTAAVVEATRGQNGTVIFNAVTNWPINAVAPSREDVVYIEVWEPYTGFNDFYWLINQAQELGQGKSVVIAAYINPRYEANARLNDAVIFGSGAGHIELGENGRYLTKPYFPDYGFMSPELTAAIRRYYDFAVRYQNVIGPTVLPSRVTVDETVSIAGVDTSPRTFTNKVMPIVRQSEGYTAVNLINLLGLEEGLWAKDTSHPPTLLKNAAVTFNEVDKEAIAVWIASPDQTDFALQAVDFVQNGDGLMLTVPTLEYWTMILIQWAE